ncbi:hypothetical protein P4597_20720 [Peribacillus simplex]|uniref:hypothetical protein n=1 Tax=Peribacillus simplex TaxID=1478 RepID=UPI002E23655C|nr:hypothetical protein [Peribacillus simplex]
MTFLKGIGEDTSDLERTTQLPENQYLHKANETADIERPTSRKSYGSSIPSKSGIEKKTKHKLVLDCSRSFACNHSANFIEK